MKKPYLVAGGGLLGLVGVVAFYGVPVPIKTGSLSPNQDPKYVGCYTSGDGGDLVTDPTSGTAIIEGGGRRVAVTWPIGWTGGMNVFGMQVIDTQGNVAAQTGTQVYLMGGSWYVDNSFLTCGLGQFP